MERRVRLSHRQRLLRRRAGYSWSTAGLRNGRSSPRATVSGIANEYRPSMLMWSWISGESLATSASQTWYPSKRNWPTVLLAAKTDGSVFYDKLTPSIAARLNSNKGTKSLTGP